MTTTLNKIKSFEPCDDGWKKLLNHLGKTSADDEELSIRTIFESNGIDDALWALRSVEGEEKNMLLLCADIAETVAHIYNKEYPNDNRINAAIQAKRDYANGLITEDQYNAARDAARDAAWAAARDAAWAAARAAAWDAAWDAARAAAWAAARDAHMNDVIKPILLKYI